MEMETVGLKQKIKCYLVFLVLGSGGHSTNKGDILYRRSILEGHMEALGNVPCCNSAAAKSLELGKQPEL